MEKSRVEGRVADMIKVPRPCACRRAALIGSSSVYSRGMIYGRGRMWWEGSTDDHERMVVRVRVGGWASNGRGRASRSREKEKGKKARLTKPRAGAVVKAKKKEKEKNDRNRKRRRSQETKRGTSRQGMEGRSSEGHVHSCVQLQARMNALS